MPISLTCSCGARLEIDDKFAGQSIPCPDCSRPLIAAPPAPPPTRTSGLAVLSLLLALIGAFTIVGTLAAVVCGAIAYRDLTRRRSPVGGVRFAQAGMILGAGFTVLTMLALSTQVPLLGIDSLARRYIWERYNNLSPVVGVVPKKRTADDMTFSIEVPWAGGWGMVNKTSNKDSDNLMLVNLRDDAQILWLSGQVARDEFQDPAGLRGRALDYFRASELVKLVGSMPDNESEALQVRDVDDTTRDQRFVIDATLGGIPRTFIFYLSPQGQYLNVLVGGVRTPRFAGVKDKLLDALKTFKQEGP